MEHFIQEKDITTGCVTAASFPGGVMAAHERVHSLVADKNRRFYGISRPEGSSILYRAGAEMTAAEAAASGLDVITLRAGTYIGIIIRDFMKNIPAIGQAFHNILAEPGLDPQGYCVEWYLNDTDVQCMVRLEQ